MHEAEAFQADARAPRCGMNIPSFIAPDPRIAALARIASLIASRKVCDTKRRFLEGRAYDIRHQLMIEGVSLDADA